MGCVTPDWGGVDQSGSEFASVSAFCGSVYAIPAGPVREEMADLFFLKPLAMFQREHGQRMFHMLLVPGIERMRIREEERVSSYWLLESEDNGSGRMAAHVGGVDQESATAPR
ncbi:hypothetical protein TNCV_4561061 [Trichonephila clavipes]|nr:hypothetical protein TNCV_4561061 [Trichonephila clavipes]